MIYELSGFACDIGTTAPYEVVHMSEVSHLFLSFPFLVFDFLILMWKDERAEGGDQAGR